LSHIIVARWRAREGSAELNRYCTSWPEPLGVSQVTCSSRFIATRPTATSFFCTRFTHQSRHLTITAQPSTSRSSFSRGPCRCWRAVKSTLMQSWMPDEAIVQLLCGPEDSHEERGAPERHCCRAQVSAMADCGAAACTCFQSSCAECQPATPKVAAAAFPPATRQSGNPRNLRRR
jgi:hypothetical protein